MSTFSSPIHNNFQEDTNVWRERVEGKIIFILITILLVDLSD